MAEQALVVGVVREPDPDEHRVALTPDGVTRLRALGLEVLVEEGAGERALLLDETYRAAGAEVVPGAEVRRRAGLVVRVAPPPDAEVARAPRGQAVVALLAPLAHPDRAQRLADAGLVGISLDTLPRTLSRAQAMDVLTSQASVAGYQAVMVAASTYDGFFPMLTTAAGTTRPAAVLVIGAGVAGLQALATARRLGAVVTGSDVREAAKGDVLSTGAKFLDLGGAAASGSGGYARELSDEEKAVQQQAVAEAIARFDVVITTAQVPGGRPPVLVDEGAVRQLAPGSVVVDLASGPLGGNVAGSVPGTTTVTPHGVVLVGAGNLPSRMPRAASTAFSRNVCALLASLVKDGALAIDMSDEVHAGVVVTMDGRVVHPGVLERLAKSSAVA